MLQSPNYYDNGFANPLGLTNYPYTSPVGYYPAYGYGMCDMAGNVWEWTSTVDGSSCVFRGGSWFSSKGFCHVIVRILDAPYSSNNYIGFRVCR